MKIKDLTEADAAAATAKFASGFGGAALGAAGALTKPAVDWVMQKKKDQVDFINKFAREATNSLNSAEKLSQRFALKTKSRTPKDTPTDYTGPTGQKFRWGGDEYTQTDKGWINSKGQPADANTAKVLNLAAAKAGSSISESQLHKVYSRLIKDTEFRQLVESRGYDINKSIQKIEKIFENSVARTFQDSENAPVLDAGTYVKNYVITKYLTVQQIEELGPKIDPILRNLTAHYPVIAKELDQLGRIIYPETTHKTQSLGHFYNNPPGQRIT